MNGAKVTCLLEGVAKFKRAVELMNAGTAARTRAAITKGTKAVAAGARSRAPKRSGEMAHTIRDEYSKSGMVGFVKVGYGTLLRRSRSLSAKALAKHQAKMAARQAAFAKAKSSRAALAAANLGIYAPVVEHGDPRRHHRPHAFLKPSLAAERSQILSDLAAAPQDAAKQSGVV